MCQESSPWCEAMDCYRHLKDPWSDGSARPSGMCTTYLDISSRPAIRRSLAREQLASHTAARLFCFRFTMWGEAHDGQTRSCLHSSTCQKTLRSDGGLRTHATGPGYTQVSSSAVGTHQIRDMSLTLPPSSLLFQLGRMGAVSGRRH
jgi:hypothetical protein